MRYSVSLFRGVGVAAAIASGAFGLAACTYVERTPPAATVVTPAPQPTVVAPAAPASTVTVRPTY